MPAPKDPEARQRWIERLSAAHLGVPNPKNSIALTGRKIPPEIVEKTISKIRGVPRPDVSLLFKGVPKKTEHKLKVAISNTGQKRTVEQKKHMSEAKLGIPNPKISSTKLAKNGTGKPLDWRSVQDYYLWTEGVRKRDNYCCAGCGISEEKYKENQKVTVRKKSLISHHIFDPERFPQFRYDISKGKTLCHSCHMQEHVRLARLKQCLALISSWVISRVITEVFKTSIQQSTISLTFPLRKVSNA